MTQHDLVTVLMPCYNSQKYIATAIESILGQTHQNFEFVIIDDASTDLSIQIVESFARKDHRIILIRNNTNSGVAAALNRGLALARGDFIARMDADDISEPTRIEKQLAFMKSNPNCIVCGSHVTLIDENDHRIGIRKYSLSDHDNKKALLYHNPFAHPATMIRTNIRGTHLFPYDEHKAHVEDYDLWFRLAPYGEFRNLPLLLLRYRLSNAAIKNCYTRKMILNTIKLKKEYLKLTNILAILNLILETLLLLLPRTTILWLFKTKWVGR